MECDWCHREYTPKNVRKNGNHFCSAACRVAYNRWDKERPKESVFTIIKQQPTEEVRKLVAKSEDEINTISGCVVELKGIASTLSSIAGSDSARLKPLCASLSDGINDLLERNGL